MTTIDSSIPSRQGASILDRLREKRRADGDAQTFDLPIAGWGGEIVARYRLLDPLVELKEILDRARRSFPDDPESQNFWGQVDAMIAACVGLYARDDDGRLVPLTIGEGGEPARYTVELAEELEVATPDMKARDVVVGVFKGNKMALGAHAGSLLMRMSDPEGTLRLGER